MRSGCANLGAAMKRPGLTVQIFLAVLATAALVALGMGLATQFSFQRGFIGFLSAQEADRAQALVPRLRQAYTDRGGWGSFADRPGAWFRFIEADTRGEPGSPRDASPEENAPHLLGFGRRLTLQDAQRQRIVGYPHTHAGSVQREITLEGRTIGWLVLAPIQSVTDGAALRFQQEQLRVALAMGVLSLGLAGLIAWWMARALLAPVREVARATHRLAAGHHDIRVRVRSQDEVGQLAQDFNQLARALGRTEQMRRDFMADISHELRTPLAVLRGELEAIEDGIHAPTPETIHMLQAEVGTLAQLVGDLHALALADAGALSYHRADLDLTTLLHEEASRFRTHCAERRLVLDVVAPMQRVTLLADEARLRQLLHNLLDNAVRYTAPGGRLRLALAVDGPAGEAVIDLQDSAPGVAPELLPRLFERFFRVEASRGRAGGGSGLGLAICRSIVQAHGGRITAQASPLGGLWMAIRLPLNRSSLD